MPETVLEVPIEIKEPKLKSDKYDLIIFAYQPWYLSLSLPAVSVLQNKTLKRIFNNTNVITIVGSRNMWYNAHIELKKYFSLLNAKHIGNIVLYDKNPNLISAITVQYWMFTGKKDKWLGVFPKPGISEADITKAESIGNLTLQNFKKNQTENIQSDLAKNKAIEFNYNNFFIESRGKKMFKIWAKTILKKHNRKLWISLFKYYLIIVLFIVSPIIMTFFIILIKPFIYNKIKSIKEIYLYNKI